MTFLKTSDSELASDTVYDKHLALCIAFGKCLINNRHIESPWRKKMRSFSWEC